MNRIDAETMAAAILILSAVFTAGAIFGALVTWVAL